MCGDWGNSWRNSGLDFRTGIISVKESDIHGVGTTYCFDSCDVGDYVFLPSQVI